MRKQYHFWRDDAWDVDRLVELSRDLPVLDVPLETIAEVDSNYWFTHQAPTVRAVIEHVRLIHDVDTAYPIILGADGRVMDGMHRIARAVLEGRRTIKGVRFAVNPEPDYRHCRPEDLSYDEHDA